MIQNYKIGSVPPMYPEDVPAQPPSDPHPTIPWQPANQPQYGPPAHPAPPVVGYPAAPVPPPVPPTKKRRTPLILGIVGALVVVCCGGGAIIATTSSNKPATHNAAATATTQPAQAAVATTPAVPTTKAAPPPPPPSPTPPPAPKTLLTLNGSGIKKTAVFTTGPEWALSYSYDCSGFAGGTGNFSVDEYDSDGTPEDVLVNELDKGGKDTVPQHADPGSHYLQIGSECKWTITVTE